jgi:hypothetical protein
MNITVPFESSAMFRSNEAKAAIGAPGAGWPAWTTFPEAPGASLMMAESPPAGAPLPASEAQNATHDPATLGADAKST